MKIAACDEPLIKIRNYVQLCGGDCLKAVERGFLTPKRSMVMDILKTSSKPLFLKRYKMSGSILSFHQLVQKLCCFKK